MLSRRLREHLVVLPWPMPRLTIELPEEIMPVLARKAEGWSQTPEGFLSDYVVLCLEKDDPPADPAREALEDILEERDKGPFITITDSEALKERVMAKALARVHRDRGSNVVSHAL